MFRRAPLSVEIVFDRYAAPSAILKDLRLACICSLGFAGFFRYDELSTIVPARLELFPGYSRIFVFEE